MIFVLRQLIAQGKTRRVIQELLKIAQQLDEEDLREEIVLQSARYEQYAKEQRLGTATPEKQSTDLAKINQALLHIVDRLPAKVISQLLEKQVNSKYKKKWGQWIVTAGVLIAILAGIAKWSGFTSPYEWSPDKESTNELPETKPDRDLDSAHTEEIPPEESPPKPTPSKEIHQSTQGKNSPAVINEGDGPVIINYGDWEHSQSDTSSQ